MTMVAVTTAALRTPPFALFSRRLVPAVAEELLDAWLAEDPELPGGHADPSTTGALAEAWRARRAAPRAYQSMAMHALEDGVDPPRPPPGEAPLRRAQSGSC